MGLGGFGKRFGGHHHTGQATAFQVIDVVHTARRTRSSIGEGFDDRRTLGGDLVAQVDRGRLGERWLGVAQNGGALRYAAAELKDDPSLCQL